MSQEKVYNLNTYEFVIIWKQNLWPESGSELYRPRDCSMSAKLVTTFADRGCPVVSVTDPYGLILGFIVWSRYLFFQVAPQFYSWGWVDPVTDPLIVRKSGSVGNRIWDLWICSQELWPLDNRVGAESNDINEIITEPLNKIYMNQITSFGVVKINLDIVCNIANFMNSLQLYTIWRWKSGYLYFRSFLYFYPILRIKHFVGVK
jgi:hypothetical protein